MKRFLLAGLVGLAVLAVPAMASADTIHLVPGAHAAGANGFFQSTNWSGYSDNTVGGRKVRFIAATQVVPTADCPLTSEGSAGDATSLWVGLDGFHSQTVEQDGVAESCSDAFGEGVFPDYVAWYEMFGVQGSPAYYMTNFGSVNPGDVVRSSVNYLGNQNFALKVQDLTTGQTWRTVQSCMNTACDRNSAEVISELPGAGEGSFDLTDFGNEAYSNVRVRAANYSQGDLRGKLGYWTKNEIQMIDSIGLPMVTPTPLSAGGHQFSTPYGQGT